MLFFYPMTCTPSMPSPKDWNLIPGARGCTPESCAYRDLYIEFEKLGYDVYGVSTQSHEGQEEFAKREHIPFEILCDFRLELVRALRLPTFSVPEVRMPLIKRLTIVTQSARIEKVFYPVFPPDKNAEDVLKYLQQSGH